ncbi:MAG TPA: TetR/AcrR family transcriptional regulator [Roseiarcus sp.]|jgi:AcrR family transcriptional regulator|nr:TetR/AcrR family transcriptional regulator [Roseiarcus sp.]
METAQTTRKDQRRDSILAVASEVFGEEGFQAASMSNIAARLGGSKGTLYNYFSSKEALFEAYIRESCGRVGSEIVDFADERPVPEVLQKFGERFLDRTYSDWAVRTFQIVIAEARRSPELARTFFDSGPMVGHDRLSEYFRIAKARGEIRPEDCGEAAWQFLGLCRIHHLEVTLGVQSKPSSEAIAKQVAWAVEMFMMRYGAR